MIVKKAAGFNQVEAWNSLAQQIATLTQKVEVFQVNTQSLSQHENCDICGAIKNLEIQMSQLATLMSGQIKGFLPSNNEKNSKEHLKAISLRSDKTLDHPYADRQGKPQEVEQVNKDALKQMPAYAKFLNEILSSKRKLEEVSVVKLTEKCASINLMPFSIFRKLELGEMKDTGVSLQFADQSTKKPKGIPENVLVRVDKFIFPVDFILLEMEENTEVPLILGRPLLATGRAIIDVYQGQLILRVDEERVILDMQKIMKYPEDESLSTSCFQIDLLNDLADEYKDDHLNTDSLERCLAKSAIPTFSFTYI
ncbi:uncharacterized protein [Nicotiana tomentosiformis]|uniref:uncharacterized protein n=1 Tax=Nicotiana tomentosiformis TaxID=4098 RepID=UPI00388C5F86